MGTPSKFDVAKFIERLQAITSAANVNSINLAERDFVAKAARFNGLVTISNAFRSFVIDTIDTLNDVWGPHVASAPPSYIWLLPRLAQGFHWLCGAEQQAFAGYPYPAFAQVRNIFDSAVVTSADTFIGEYVDAPDKPGAWTFLSGTGKWKGISGSGTYQPVAMGKPAADGSIEFCTLLTGKYTLPQ